MFQRTSRCVQRTSLPCSAHKPSLSSVHYSLTKPMFCLLHSSCHFQESTQTISWLKMEALPLTPVSAACLRTFILLSLRMFRIQISEIFHHFLLEQKHSNFNITINSESAINDIIGFRIFAVNYDGTLVDPNG